MVTCRVCKNDKSLSEMVLNRAKKRGYDTECRDCRKKRISPNARLFERIQVDSTKTESEIFESRCIPVPFSGCWLWIGGSKYPAFRHNKEMEQASHAALRIYRGIILPKGMLACHKCDVPCCVNPHHLFVGTYLDNNRDRAAKGRSRYATAQPKRRGEKNASARLTESLVIAIRKDTRPILTIAKELGVPKSTIWNVRAGNSWKYLLPDEGAA